MGAKRALIVDDSKSARVFLARMLENYDIDVDSAESAEPAIEYLTSNRPDVIFMDHHDAGHGRFSGRAGHQEQSAHRHHPDHDVHLPGGELYLGQARALGAVGVLPKQIKPTDVSKVLYQLHLVPDRRNPSRPASRPLNAARRWRAAMQARPGSRALTETHAARAFRRAAPRAGGRRRHPDRSHYRRGARAVAGVLPPPTPARPGDTALRRGSWRRRSWLIGLRALPPGGERATQLEAVRTEARLSSTGAGDATAAAGAATAGGERCEHRRGCRRRRHAARQNRRRPRSKPDHRAGPLWRRCRSVARGLKSSASSSTGSPSRK